MGSDIRTGEMPAIPEDTIDLGERLDPTRTLLRRAAGGDQRAAAALVDVLGPRIHGLSVHVTGSSARAEKLAVTVLRSCLREAGDLAASGLPGEAAVLDRARRAAVATNPSGDVRSLVAPDLVNDRTRDRREVEVLRVLLELPPAHRALVESAAQGRFSYTGQPRQQNAVILSQALDQLVPFGGPPDVETRALAALDALALAEEGERLRLRELTRYPETAGIHRHAIEAAARLALLTTVPPSRDLRLAVLEGFGAVRTDGARSSPLSARPAGAAEPEPSYRGDYATPVLGTDSQRRMVGPPAMAGGRHSSAVEPQDGSSMAASSEAALPTGAPEGASSPAFSFRATDEKQRSRRDRRREKRRTEQGRRGVPWFSRTVAAAAVAALLVLGYLLSDVHHQLEESERLASAWANHTMTAGAQLVPGVSDNGTWRAVITEDGISLRAEGVVGWEDEVLELWGETDGVQRSLGVLDLADDGSIRFTTEESDERLFVTREMPPGNESGTPSERVVASLDPAVSGV
ncbi:RNA polymerase sigma factor [Brachybacterium sp. AOP35-5H-19]|uniref:RNA polymerase sigma factor n=1 Tax=Brachybacterium sp. AOP35-5H-19 TaxID=3457685 RepID=UPI004034520B